MKKHLLFKFILAVGDVLILFGGFLLSYHLRFSLTLFPQRPIPPFDLYFNFAFLVAFMGFLMAYNSGMYRLKNPVFKIEDSFLVFRAVTLTLLIVMAMGFALRGFNTQYDIEAYSRLIIATAWIVNLIALTLWRWGFYRFLRYLFRRGNALKRIVIVGTNKTACDFYRAIKETEELAYLPIGFLTNGESGAEIDRLSNEIRDGQIFGGIDNLPSVLRSERVNEVVMASVNLDTDVIASTIKICKRADVQFSIVPNFFQILMHQMHIEEIANIPIFQLDERIFHQSGRFFKRGMDIVLSLCVSVFLAPVWLLLAICIRLDSKGPVLFRQQRVGKGEKVFHVYKFRSMVQDAEKILDEVVAHNPSNDTLLKLKKDFRVTRIGRFMRRFSLDEFPQLVNVLKGEMSWIGPRPHTIEEVKGYENWHYGRHDVLPGITGLTQISGRKNLSLDEMARLDIYYVENWSPILDLQILLRTIPAVLKGQGAY